MSENPTTPTKRFASSSSPSSSKRFFSSPESSPVKGKPNFIVVFKNCFSKIL